ncbi:hypothetical protein V6N13_060029 [Hibiscus sabdariffa]
MRTLFYFSSSFISELFGSKGSPSPPTGTLGSILAPPSKEGSLNVLLRSEAKSQHSQNEPWNTKPGASGHEDENQNIQYKTRVSRE